VKLIVADPEEEGQRLDRWLAERLPGQSRTAIQRLIRMGKVHINGATAKPSLPLVLGMEVEVELEPPPSLLPQPEEITLRVIYEDADLIAIDKPPGMVTHPAPGHLRGTVVNALLYHCQGQLAETGDPLRPGIIHRLDKGTSGVLVAAKSELAYRSLVEQFKHGRVRKCYLALVHGLIVEDEGLIELPLAPDHRGERMRVSHEGKPAVTEFTVLRRLPDRKTLIEARPRTGRMHQIRVHLSYIKHPVVGDPKYGRRDESGRMMLHARELEIEHPKSKGRLRLIAPLPPEFAQLMPDGAR